MVAAHSVCNSSTFDTIRLLGIIAVISSGSIACFLLVFTVTASNLSISCLACDFFVATVTTGELTSSGLLVNMPRHASDVPHSFAY